MKIFFVDACGKKQLLEEAKKTHLYKHAKWNNFFNFFYYFKNVHFLFYEIYIAPKKNNQTHNLYVFLHLILSHKLNSTYLYFTQNDIWLTNKDSIKTLKILLNYNFFLTVVPLLFDSLDGGAWPFCLINSGNFNRH